MNIPPVNYQLQVSDFNYERVEKFCNMQIIVGAVASAWFATLSLAFQSWKGVCAESKKSYLFAQITLGYAITISAISLGHMLWKKSNPYDKFIDIGFEEGEGLIPLAQNLAKTDYALKEEQKALFEAQIDATKKQSLAYITKLIDDKLTKASKLREEADVQYNQKVEEAKKSYETAIGAIDKSATKDAKTAAKTKALDEKTKLDNEAKEQKDQLLNQAKLVDEEVEGLRKKAGIQ